MLRLTMTKAKHYAFHFNSVRTTRLQPTACLPTDRPTDRLTDRPTTSINRPPTSQQENQRPYKMLQSQANDLTKGAIGFCQKIHINFYNAHR